MQAINDMQKNISSKIMTTEAVMTKAIAIVKSSGKIRRIIIVRCHTKSPLSLELTSQVMTFIHDIIKAKHFLYHI